MTKSCGILLAILLFNSHVTIRAGLETSQTDSTYCVSPIPDVRYQNHTCGTLSHYVANITRYLTLRTTLLFLPGIHALASGMVVISDLEAVNLIGVKLLSSDRPSVINGTHSLNAGITFKNVTRVSVVDLTLANCGAFCVGECVIKDTFADIPSIVALNVESFTFIGSAIENSTKVGIVADHVDNLTIVNSTFVGNNLDNEYCALVTSYSNTVIESSLFSAWGHGIEIENGTLSIDASWIIRNAEGIKVKNGAAYLRAMKIFGIRYIIIGNRVKGGLGIVCENSTLTVSHSSCSKCDACVVANACAVNISFCDLQRNNDGIRAYTGSEFQVTDSTFVYHTGFSQFHQDSIAFVRNTTFYNNSRSCIFASNSTIKFNENSLFQNCTSLGFGGALYLDSSFMRLIAPANVTFVNNDAYLGGGAIYAQSPFIVPFTSCFLQIEDEMGTLQNPGVHLHFEGNKARKGGSVLYGNIQSCDLSSYNGYCNYPFKVFIAISTMDNSSSLAISSDPFTICVCNETGPPDCALTQHYSCYPGQTVSIVGQDLYGNAVPSTAVSYTADFDPSVAMLLNLQCSYNSCYDYVVKSHLNGRKVYILTQSAVSQSEYLQPLCIEFEIFDCPMGFVLNGSSGTCVCSQFLLEANFTCDIKNRTVLKQDRQWVGTISNTIVVYRSCPYDYCLPSPISVSLDAPNYQCRYNRAGILCGGCIPGTSAGFGTSRCTECSNYHLFHLITFAVMGVVLVTTLFVLNLTVSTGTINGLVFYANVVSTCDTIFFSADPKYTALDVLRTFVAWVNLDFGIQTCFYDGMDGYAKMWLNLAFPTYILTIVSAVVLAGKKCSLVSRVFGRNVIPVLATLLLLSFGKFVQLSITMLSPAKLVVDSGDGSTSIAKLRLLFDGTIEYLGYRHIPLFLIGILIILAVVPFLLLLLFSSCLVSWSHVRCCAWVNSLKPFIDSFHAPFNPRFRFWPGALLTVRLFLYVLVSSNNSQGGPFRLLAVIICNLLPLFVVSVFPVYRKWYCTLLEVFFYLNATFLSAAQLYLLVKGEGTGPSSYTLLTVGGAFLATGVIVAWHLFSRVRELMAKLRPISTPLEIKPLVNKAKDCDTPLQKCGDDSANLREPLVED